MVPPVELLVEPPDEPDEDALELVDEEALLLDELELEPLVLPEEPKLLDPPVAPELVEEVLVDAPELVAPELVELDEVDVPLELELELPLLDEPELPWLDEPWLDEPWLELPWLEEPWLELPWLDEPPLEPFWF